MNKLVLILMFVSSVCFGTDAIFNNSGNVGIGITNPRGLLDVTTTTTTGFTSLFVSGTGNVGIGTTNPLTKLYVIGTASFTTVNVTNPITVANGGTGLTTFTSNVIYKGNGTGALSTSLFSDDGTYCGVGTLNTYARFQVNNTAGSWTGWIYYNYYDSGIYWTKTGGAVVQDANSIYCAGYFLCSQIDVFSDERIKNIIRNSNSTADLETINKIEVVDYKFKDPVRYDNREHKKVIAQQIEKYTPENVRKTTDIIPSVFETAKSVKQNGSDLIITTNKEHGFTKGDIIKILLDEKIIPQIKVKDVIDKTTFIVEGKADKVFVYGKEVDDFRVVDYEGLTCLGISATQELYKIIKELKQENNNLKSRIEVLEKK